MSEGTFPKDILKYVVHSSFSLKEKAFELHTAREDEEEKNPALSDDALDDSSSSYCTALCSLSEYSEALEDETQTTFTDPPCENALFDSSQSLADSSRTMTNSSPENTDLLQDLKTKQKDAKSSCEDSLHKEPQYCKNKAFAKNPIFKSSSPKITILNVNLININSVHGEQDSTTTSTPNPTPSDYFKSNNNAGQTATKPVHYVGYLEHKISPCTILMRSKGDKNNQEWSQEHSDIKAEENTTTLQQISRNAQYEHNTEFKLDSGESIIRKMKCEGEEQGIGVGGEQAKLSLNTGNRKPPASCTSTLTASKQKSGILPRCYSKRFLATRNQHQSQSPPVLRRLKKQSGQGIGLSTALPPAPCSTSRQHCSSAESTKGKLNMATDVAGTTMEVRSLATLEYTGTSCPEINYPDAFNSTCWSSTQLTPDKDFYDWSKDVLSFKMPMISTNKNDTSACSVASSFECIDVALENHEEVDKNAKMVPKRQIQLKRRDKSVPDKSEFQASEKNIISSTPIRPRDTLQRQHSTPAAFHQDSHGAETKSGLPEQKQKLQKSLSLDETSTKTKMASCIIKNVLSKRMQHEQNLNSDIPDQTFCPIKADDTGNNIDFLTTCAKEECGENNIVNLTTVSFLSCNTSQTSQSPTLKTDSQTTNYIKEHIGVSSKILPKLITKHSFNPLLGGLGKMQFQGSGTEIAAYSEAEKEKLGLSKEANQGNGERLFCDSAKGKAWNLSAVSSGAAGKQTTVKTTPEECVSMQAAQKDHYVKDQSIEEQEKSGEEKKSKQSPTVSTWLNCSQDANTVDNVLSQSSQCNLEKDQENSRGDLKALGQSLNMSTQSQGKFKAIAPVHVVRDMRSLVKNTYSLSFKGPSEAVQELEDIVPSFATAAPHPVISKMENKVKGHKKDEKLHVQKGILPCALDTVINLASTSRQCASKADTILESNDKIPHTGFTKVSAIIAAHSTSCGLSKSPDAHDSLTCISLPRLQCSNDIKQTTSPSTPIQAHKGSINSICKNEQSTDTRTPECKKPRTFALHSTQPLETASSYCVPVESSDQQGSCKISNLVCPTDKDGQESPGLPIQSQSTTGLPSSSILTVAPAPVFPSYFYKPNLLGYQTISPNIGTVSYVQGPLLLQTQPYNQPATANCPVSLTKSPSQPCTTDGHPVPKELTKQMENGVASQKISSPDTQPCTASVTTLGAEGIHGGASMLYPEMSGIQHGSNPRHMLLDPETGQCFYVDMPQLPQRKMLFDPETCQYVEVVVPQQTLSSSVMTTPCAIPLSSFPIPAMYSPHCLSYIQTHHPVLPPPEP